MFFYQVIKIVINSTSFKKKIHVSLQTIMFSYNYNYIIIYSRNHTNY